MLDCSDVPQPMFWLNLSRCTNYYPTSLSGNIPLSYVRSARQELKSLQVSVSSHAARVEAPQGVSICCTEHCIIGQNRAKNLHLSSAARICRRTLKISSYPSIYNSAKARGVGVTSLSAGSILRSKNRIVSALPRD